VADGRARDVRLLRDHPGTAWTRHCSAHATWPTQRPFSRWAPRAQGPCTGQTRSAATHRSRNEAPRLQAAAREDPARSEGGRSPSPVRTSLTTRTSTHPRAAGPLFPTNVYPDRGADVRGVGGSALLPHPWATLRRGDDGDLRHRASGLPAAATSRRCWTSTSGFLRYVQLPGARRGPAPAGPACAPGRATPTTGKPHVRRARGGTGRPGRCSGPGGPVGSTSPWCPGGLVVNLGGPCCSRWTNDAWRSTMHRVAVAGRGSLDELRPPLDRLLPRDENWDARDRRASTCCTSLPTTNRPAIRATTAPAGTTTNGFHAPADAHDPDGRPSQGGSR